MSKKIFGVFEIVVNIVIEMCMFLGILKLATDEMPEVYKSLIENNVDKSLAGALVVIGVICSMAFMYRIMDLIRNIGKDGAKYDINNKKTGSSNTVTTYEHHA